MPSDRKIAANRANGALSRGPKTPEGKARSARNSLKHGLLARAILLEWHADSLGSAGVEGVRARLRDGGFSRMRDFGASPDGATGHILASRD